MRRNRTPLRSRSLGGVKYTVEKARPEDAAAIMAVAITAGKATKDSDAGFLMDDYTSNPAEHRQQFAEAADKSRFFYIVKNDSGRVLGFLLAHRRARWLRIEPMWLEQVIWRPDFDKARLDDFVLLEKIAVDSELRGTGLGSEMFAQFRQDALAAGITDMFSETIIGPRPNFAALAFALKQKYTLAGIRYEEYDGKMLTDVVYHRKL